MAGLTGWHLVILLGVVVLLFGAKKLPDMARSVGQSARILRGEMKAMDGDDQGRQAATTPIGSATPASAADEPNDQDKPADGQR